MIRMASSEWRGRGPERWTTGVPAPIVSLALRLLLLSRWSRRTGLRVVIASRSETKRSILLGGGPGDSESGEGRRWMPDEDSNLD